jgi:hypothetical protein
MLNKIGFSAETPQEQAEKEIAQPRQSETPRRSIVQVRFPKDDRRLTYYNDRFDLHRGDMVFVEGSYEGIRGRMMEVNYNFKIKLSDYKKVVSVADTDVQGKFYMANMHFVTFDRAALPVNKAKSWYLPVQEAEDEIIRGSDEKGFSLYDLKDFRVSEAIADRGHEYYLENRVVYFCIDGTSGFAIIEGSKPYTVEFHYEDGEIQGLVCSCFCSGACKHEFAAMLQLRETMECIEENYAAEYKDSGYFAAVSKSAMFHFPIDSMDIGSLILQKREPAKNTE